MLINGSQEQQHADNAGDHPHHLDTHAKSDLPAADEFPSYQVRPDSRASQHSQQSSHHSPPHSASATPHTNGHHSYSVASGQSYLGHPSGGGGGGGAKSPQPYYTRGNAVYDDGNAHREDEMW